MFALSAAGLGGAETSAAAEEPRTYPIVVDAGSSSGEFFYILRTGVFALSFSEHARYPYEKLLAERLVGGFRNSLPLNGHVHWKNCSPKDYDDWRRIIETTVKHFSVTKGYNVVYSVWTEPDYESYVGTLEDYFEFHAQTVTAIKRVAPSAKVLLPGVISATGPHLYADFSVNPPVLRKTKTAFLPDFLRWAATTPLPKVGLHRVPIDQAEIHIFGADPYGSEIAHQAKAIRDTLRQYGYPTDIPLSIEYTNQFDGATEIGASFNVATVAAAIDAGFSRTLYNSLFDSATSKSGWQTGVFLADMTPYPRNFPHQLYVKKANYNVFQMLTTMVGDGDREMLEADLSGVEYITPLATASRNDELFIVVANYVPAGKIVAKHLKDFVSKLPSAARAVPALRDCVRNGIADAKVCADHSDVTDQRERYLLMSYARLYACIRKSDIRNCLQNVRVDNPEATRDLNQIRDKIAELDSRRRSSVRGRIRVTGLRQSGAVSVITYVVDRQHANPCPYDQAGSSMRRLCGKNSAITDRHAKAHNQAQIQTSAHLQSEAKLAGWFDGIGDGQKSEMWRCIDTATSPAASVRCVAQVRKRLCRSRDCAAVDAHLKEMRSRYETVYQDLFFHCVHRDAKRQLSVSTTECLDAINADPRISLKGSAHHDTAKIVRGTLEWGLTLEPQSVVLIHVQR